LNYFDLRSSISQRIIGKTGGLFNQGNRTVLADERRQHILQIIEGHGFVSVQELMDTCQASESTVRRDLEFLDGIGQIRRTRGGAAYVGESLSGFEDRSRHASREKRELAKVAAELIQPDETLLLDGGTTTLEVARQLIGKPYQIVTNSLPIANLLANQQGIELIFIGGYLYPKTGVALGPVAMAALKNINAHRLIMSVGGITEKGLFNSNALLVETERQMMLAADEVMVVCDSGKLGRSALAYLCELSAIDHLVVDSGITPHWQKIFEDLGTKLTIAEIGQPQET
jgi:DeoR/GlpR family transcriptional regulator of sugar metabolism